MQFDKVKKHYAAYALALIFIITLGLRLSFAFQTQHFSGDEAYFELRQIDEITNTGKRQSILDEQRDQFKDKKQEFDLTTFVNYDNLELQILDRVNVDYPTVFYPANAGIFHQPKSCLE